MHAALETPVPAQAEAETYPRSAIEEVIPEQVESFDAFLPRRRPAVPYPAAPGDQRDPAGYPRDPAGYPRRTPSPVPAVRHQPPDLALLDRVLGSLQRMA